MTYYLILLNRKDIIQDVEDGEKYIFKAQPIQTKLFKSQEDLYEFYKPASDLPDFEQKLMVVGVDLKDTDVLPIETADKPIHYNLKKSKAKVFFP